MYACVRVYVCVWGGGGVVCRVCSLYPYLYLVRCVCVCVKGGGGGSLCLGLYALTAY